jgi:hypothetical protein
MACVIGNCNYSSGPPLPNPTDEALCPTHLLNLPLKPVPGIPDFYTLAAMPGWTFDIAGIVVARP